MKNILTIIFVLFTGLQVVAQEVELLDDNEVYTIVEKKAEPKEGILGFFKNFADKFQSDGLAIDGSQLNFRLKFVVEKNGTFSEITFSGDNEEAGQEAIRVLKTMPAWNPAKHKRKAVRSSFTLPIKVRVNNNNAIFKQELLTQDELKFFVESLNVSVVETAYFDLKCNCALMKSSIDEENTTE